MVLRYWYLLRSSWPRIVDLIYWPAVQMLMWGFLQLYLVDKPSMAAQAGGAFIGAVLLWDILFRGQIGFSISFLEEMWSRNLGNLMMTPLRPFELIAALMVMSVVRVLIGLVPVTILAIIFFGFNFWALGLAVAGLLPEPHPDQLVDRAHLLRHGAKKGLGRGGARLVDDLHPAAALLRLLPGRDPARLAAMDRAGAAADACLRGAAGAGAGAPLRRRRRC